VDGDSTLEAGVDGWLDDPVTGLVDVAVPGPMVLDGGLEAAAEPDDPVTEGVPAVCVDPAVINAGGAPDVVQPPTRPRVMPSAIATARRTIQRRREWGTRPR
jgi:hypothetical protein